MNHPHLKRKSNKPRTVIVVLRMTGASGRALLEGIFQYVKRGIHWNIRLLQMPDMLTPAMIRDAEKEGVDGIITSEPSYTPEIAKALTRTPIPLAILAAKDTQLEGRDAPTVYVANNEMATGAVGVRLFRTLGNFNTYGFVQSFRNLVWSDLRAEGFRRAAGETAVVFQSPSPMNGKQHQPHIDRAALEQWLIDLPKPAAIMTDWDYRATQVLELCEKNRIKVPEQVSVLGVDDDVLLCDFTNPPLSSVKPDHEQVGYRAAAELDVLMNARAKTTRKKARVVLCQIKGVTERATTKPLAPSSALIKKALDYIDKHACEGATVRDVIAHLGISRSLADLRFRETLDASILDTLTKRRLNEVVRLLFTTDYSIKRISLTCGFNNIKHLKWLFKKHFHMSMRDYRKANGTQDAGFSEQTPHGGL